MPEVPAHAPGWNDPAPAEEPLVLLGPDGAVIAVTSKDNGLVGQYV